MRTLKIKWSHFEMGCDMASPESKRYLDLETGAVLVVFAETVDQLQELLADADSDASVESLIVRADAPEGRKQALGEAWHVEEHLGGRVIAFADAELGEDYRDLADFTAMVQDADVRAQLEQAIQGRGAFRRFRGAIHGCFRERKMWFAFKMTTSSSSAPRI